MWHLDFLFEWFIEWQRPFALLTLFFYYRLTQNCLVTSKSGKIVLEAIPLLLFASSMGLMKALWIYVCKFGNFAIQQSPWFFIFLINKSLTCFSSHWSGNFFVFRLTDYVVDCVLYPFFCCERMFRNRILQSFGRLRQYPLVDRVHPLTTIDESRMRPKYRSAPKQATRTQPRTFPNHNFVGSQSGNRRSTLTCFHTVEI